MFVKLSTDQRPMVGTLWPCSFHESEIQVQGNQRFFSCLSLYNLFSPVRASRSLSRGEKFPTKTSGTKVLVGMNLYKMKTISPTVYQHRLIYMYYVNKFFFNKSLVSHLHQPIFSGKLTRFFFFCRFFENNFFYFYILYKPGSDFIFVSITRWWWLYLRFVWHWNF